MKRLAMVKEQLESRGINNPAVLNAMRSVKREDFLPPALRIMAYDDGPLPIGEGQNISQPYVVALMTSMLRPEPHFRVLEIGTGSGYQAAVLAGIVAEVYSVEIVKSLAEKAKAHLENAGYKNVHLRVGDGSKGWVEAAPFDGIMVTAASLTVPPKLKEQLKVGGRMIIPLGKPGEIQGLWIVTRTENGFIEEPNIPVRFVPLAHYPLQHASGQ